MKQKSMHDRFRYHFNELDRIWLDQSLRFGCPYIMNRARGENGRWNNIRWCLERTIERDNNTISE